MSAELLEAWAARGRPFEAAGIASRVWEDGDGDPVLLVHGVPMSAYLYRRVLPQLAARGLRGVAVDLPGLGLAARPRGADYTWSGLARWLRAAVEALDLDGIHLVVHDIGGPVALAAAAGLRSRVASVTLLNTMVRVSAFRRPLPMEPFAHPVAGELYLQAVRPETFPAMLRLGWVGPDVPSAELAVHARLLRREDGGRAFLRIMRGFERTRAFEERILAVLADPPGPVQVVWGERDPGLRLDREGEDARRAAGLPAVHRLAASHFVQEDAPAGVAARVAALAARSAAPRGR